MTTGVYDNDLIVGAMAALGGEAAGRALVDAVAGRFD